MAELDVETVVALARALVKNRDNLPAVEMFIEALRMEFEGTSDG